MLMHVSKHMVMNCDKLIGKNEKQGKWAKG